MNEQESTSQSSYSLRQSHYERSEQTLRQDEQQILIPGKYDQDSSPLSNHVHRQSRRRIQSNPIIPSLLSTKLPYATYPYMSCITPSSTKPKSTTSSKCFYHLPPPLGTSLDPRKPTSISICFASIAWEGNKHHVNRATDRSYGYMSRF